MELRPATLAVSVSFLFLAACGDAPQKLTREEARAEAGPGVAVPGELPPNHPPIGAGDTRSGTGGNTALAGVVEIAGELAGVHQGTLFLVGYDAQSGAMALVRKYGHADFEHAESGESLLRFSLDQLHPTASGELSDLELEVRFDLDGIVETKEDVLATVRVPVELGDRDVHVRLDDENRTAAPLPQTAHGG